VPTKKHLSLFIYRVSEEVSFIALTPGGMAWACWMTLPSWTFKGKWLISHLVLPHKLGSAIT